MDDITRLYVDTNVFIRMFETSDEVSAALAEMFVMDRSLDDPFLATSELALAELLVLPYRDDDKRLIELYDNWTLSNPQIEVGPVLRPVLWYAAVLRAQYRAIKLPDAIHLSTAIGMGCSHFLTADTRLHGRYDLNHSRYGMRRGPIAIDIIRPDLDTINAINGLYT